VPAGLREEIEAIADETKLRRLHRSAIQAPTLDVFAGDL